MSIEESPEVPGSGVPSAESPAATDVTKTTESSPAAPKDVETSLVERVKTALGQGSEKSSVSETGEGKPSPQPAEGTGEPPDLTEPELKLLHPKTQARFRYLTEKANTLGEKTAGLEHEASVLKPKAEKLDTILSYMEKNRIEPQEFDNSLEITRLIKAGDYTKALDVLTPIYRELANRAGKILPNDLQERVRIGEITEKDARELHEARTRATNLDTRTAEQQRRDQAEQSQRETQRIVDASAQEADRWAKAKGTADPDWHLKQELVAEQVKLDILDRQSRGDRDWFPTTPAEVVKRSEAALKVVEERMKKFAPKPVEKRVATGQPSSPRSVARPTSSLEAIKQALGG